ncbi:hypothetical protein BKP35_11390 [Anaerobacillus arseniciselenatis]|uniref:ATP-grasp domain-containing protein n=1 Tax=Anaerobacillus arseniciselenatis TaxID=85682 RepID=A0A1S2LIH0_9BACI|nr:YheC/YheD family protein [Anaerobacillus arseniciselenatis]OIJ11893.1 hypothetical protein BKP35_11390 [Anaerobacillus arseniciselenatis]
MGDLGILVTNLHQEQMYFTDIAKAGCNKGMHVYLFLPTTIDANKKIAKGKRYCDITNQWVNETFSIPLFIYDRCFYENETTYKKYFPSLSWLKSQPDIVFLGHGLPNKWLVYKLLSKDPTIYSFLPETVLLSNRSQVSSMFKKHHSILFKPVSGSQGKGIFVLSKENDSFSLLAKKEGEIFFKRLTEKQVEHLLYKVMKRYKYLVQPFLSLTNQQQQPFDLRVFLQKDDQGQWQEIGRGLRTGKVGDFTSNLAGGGTVDCYDDWLRSLSSTAQVVLRKNLKELIERIPTMLEKHYPLFELGLDFGFDKEGRLWLLEVNSKPGRKVILTSFPNKENFLANGPINYCLFLQ